ncbi:AAA family ATPase [candidate division KSB1 bacterium]|nr:AAA family ATPase [candidate division KSB1 bacterium]
MEKMVDTSWLKKDLNSVQRQAVEQTEGPVLVLAGAGSGKTRVLTYRIAYILANGLAEPREILAMTFTNKAAGEMRERVAKLTPSMLSGMWIGTFHSLFARLLRREAEKLGFDHNFAIYDESDQTSLLKRVLAALKLPLKEYSPKKMLYQISAAKNNLISPADMLEASEKEVDRILARVYAEYQRQLKDLNAMDFDDLLVKPIELFERFPLVKEYYQDRFTYILVDEYQDTNRAQYLALRYLAARKKNICVVGDDDQSIYRWRGADIRNILDFEKDYSDCCKFRLEQNYRSTQNILSAAHSVIKNNRQRHHKELWTTQLSGDKVSLLEIDDDLHEARMIVNRLGMELKNGDRDFKDFALLYRTNAQSRVLEEALRVEGIPYIIVGGIKFYERKEIKDVLSYLRLLINPSDVISMTRIINTPARGVGQVTLGKIEAFAQKNNLSILEAVAQVPQIPGVSAKSVQSLLTFYHTMCKYRDLLGQLSPSEIAASLVDDIGVLRDLKQEGTIESMARVDNVRELLLAISEFSNQFGSKVTLADYLQHVSLTTDIDNWDDRANAVTLMTLHAAKGLEFSVVFIAGLEEGLFPLSRSLDDSAALEEERRLFYVGATRAKHKLYLSWARNRRRYGERINSVVSRFIKEMDGTFVDWQQKRRPVSRRSPYGSSRRYEETFDMPDYENESQENVEFRIGMRVSHHTFGKGTILKIEPSGPTAKLVVQFDTAGKRRLVMPYAKLEIL